MPSSPAGRVVFIVCEYNLTRITPRSKSGIDAMMVVPIVASFAIQTMTQIVCAT